VDDATSAIVPDEPTSASEATVRPDRAQRLWPFFGGGAVVIIALVVALRRRRHRHSE
jgi:hypothetical protein